MPDRLFQNDWSYILTECDVEQIRQIVDAAVIRRMNQVDGGTPDEMREHEISMQEDAIKLMQYLDYCSQFDPDMQPEPDPADTYAAHWDSW